MRAPLAQLAKLTLAILLWAAHAQPATGSPMESGTSGGAVFTGPLEPHASSTFINPASLYFAGRGFHLYVDSVLRLDSISVDRRIVDVESGGVLDGPSASAGILTPGGVLGWTFSAAENAHFGLALHTPVAERFIADEEALRYHSLGGYIFQTLLSAGGSWRVSGRLIVGLGISLGSTQLRLDFARDTALEGGSAGLASDCEGNPCGLENDLAAERISVDVGTAGLTGLFALENLALSAGVAVRITQNFWVALSSVNPPGAIRELDLQGTSAVTRAPRDGGGALSGDAEVSFALPQAIYLGVAGPVLPEYNVVASLRWQNLSRHDQFDVRLLGVPLEEAGVPEWYPRYRGLRDTWRLNAGLEGRDGGPMRFGGRLSAETGAVVSNTITPLQAAGLRLGAAGGAQFRFAQHFVLGVGYELAYFPSEGGDQSVFDPIDRLSCIDSGYDFDRCRGAREGRAIPTAAGDYNRIEHTFNLSVRYDSL